MAIPTLHNPLFRSILLLGIVSLVACGGGGGGSNGGNTSAGISSKAESSLSSVSSDSSNNVSSSSSSSIVATSSSSGNSSSADATPAAFSIPPTTDATLSAAITSIAVTLSGFDVAIPVSITNGEYSINGGAFTSAAGTISPKQTITVKVMSSNANSTAVDAILTVGGVSATYRVTTLADAIPDAFTFAPKVNAALGSSNASNVVTVEGIEVAASITITGGEYSIDTGAFTSAAGSVTNGQTITVKAIAPEGTELTQSAVVTIGGVSGTYSVTTIPDTTAPVAEFKFPTPYTMSDAASVIVRGTATDEHTITNVTVVVNGVTEIEATPKAAGDFSSWTAEVPLMALSENEIKVVATDDRNNQTAIEAANKVKIKQAVVDAPGFPDGANSVELGEVGLILDKQQGGERLLVANSTNQNIISTDLATGVRSVFISTDPDCYMSAIATDPVGQRLYGVCDNKLQEYNLVDGSFIAEYESPTISPDTHISAIAIDRFNDRAQLVMVEYTSPHSDPLVGGSVIAFSLANKTFSVISAANQLPLMNGATAMIPDGDRYLIINGARNLDASMHCVLAVDAITGIHSIISSNAVGAGEVFSGGFVGNYSIGLEGVVIHKSTNQLFVNEYTTGKLFSISLETGSRSVFKVFPIQRSTIFNEDILPKNWEMAVDEINHNLFVYDGARKSILIIDIETGAQVILTKSENDY